MFGSVPVDDTDFDFGESIEVLNDMGFSDSNRPFTISNDLIYIGKSLSLLDGICRQLDPDYKPLAYIQPYVEDRLSESSINLEGTLTNIIEIPSKIKNMNSSIISIEKTAYSMKAKTKTIKRDVQQTQLIMFAFIMYFLYIQ
jgi:predicted unusual protein kinase regulating ubiquinone biosynthesis (AarF/ABC1/UbiB family)